MMSFVLGPETSGHGDGKNGQKGKSSVHVSILG
jgi:hypothetical protein